MKNSSCNPYQDYAVENIASELEEFLDNLEGSGCPTIDVILHTEIKILPYLIVVPEDVSRSVLHFFYEAEVLSRISDCMQPFVHLFEEYNVHDFTNHFGCCSKDFSSHLRTRYYSLEERLLELIS